MSVTDVKIWYPKQYTSTSYNSIEDYKLKCAADLIVFKGILKKNLNLSRWDAIEERLIQSGELHFVGDAKISPIAIAQKYISCLTCCTDNSVKRCYYEVFPIVMCSNTNDSLSRIIRIIEFGFADICPMNWIRHSYIAFTEYVDGSDSN